MSLKGSEEFARRLKEQQLEDKRRAQQQRRDRISKLVNVGIGFFILLGGGYVGYTLREDGHILLAIVQVLIVFISLLLYHDSNERNK